MFIHPNVVEQFNNRLQDAVTMIKESNIPYVKLGVFGSYARGEYSSRSDLDICMICDPLPARMQVSELLCNLIDIKVDLTVMSLDRFTNEDSRFMSALRRDFKEVL